MVPNQTEPLSSGSKFFKSEPIRSSLLIRTEPNHRIRFRSWILKKPNRTGPWTPLAKHMHLKAYARAWKEMGKVSKRIRISCVYRFAANLTFVFHFSQKFMVYSVFCVKKRQVMALNCYVSLARNEQRFIFYFVTILF